MECRVEFSLPNEQCLCVKLVILKRSQVGRLHASNFVLADSLKPIFRVHELYGEIKCEFTERQKWLRQKKLLGQKYRNVDEAGGLL